MKKDMIFDHDELENRLRYLRITKESFADQMGLTRGAINNFISGKSHWTDEQLLKAASIVKCTGSKDFYNLFFTVKTLQNVDL